MKKPEEIKRGLECDRYGECTGCVYEEIAECGDCGHDEKKCANMVQIYVRGCGIQQESAGEKRQARKSEMAEAAEKDPGWEYIYRQLAEKCVKLTQATMQVIHVANGEQSADIDDTIDRYINALADVHCGIQIARLDLEPEETARFNQRVSAQKIKLLSRLSEME